MGGTLPGVVGVRGWQLLDVHVVLVCARDVWVCAGVEDVVVVVLDAVVGVAVAVAVAVAVTVELVELVVLIGEVVPAPVELAPAAGV